MNKIMQKVLSIILATLMCITSLPLFAVADEARQPREWFVSLTGDDEIGTGTIDKPFRTLQKGADMLQAGDTLYIREGVYDESFKLKSSGTAEAPITIKPYNDEEVTVRATTGLKNWDKATAVGSNIWVTDMTFDKATGGWKDDCLFDGETTMILARYPNIPEGGTPMWPVQLEMDNATRNSTELVRLGTIWDSELTEEDGYWDGAKVHMQSGLNWYNVTADVERYEKGILYLRDHNYVDASYYNEKAGDKYYIKDHIHCLDTTNEYYIDYENKKVYIYSEENPNNKEIGARSNTYTIDISDVSYVNIEGFNLRGAGPKYNDNTSYTNVDWMSIGGVESFSLLGNHNTIKHSHLFDAPNELLNIKGEYNALFNSLVENANWSGGNSSEVSVSDTATYAYVAYNTITNAGRTAFAGKGTNSVYEYNRFSNAGSLTCDTGITYTSHGGPGMSEYRYNWLYDITSRSTAFGLYYDNSGSSVAIHHNVVWDNFEDTGELKVNSWGAILLNDPNEAFSVYNNTFIGDAHSSNTLKLNNDGRYMNNIFVGEIQTVVQYEAQRNNLVGWLDPGFVDMRNYDFRLREDSIAIDNGIFIDGVTDDYVGEAPDLGAYEYGGEYWIPGHNWENPPEYVHQTPNYIQWHNLVPQASFEDDQEFAPSRANETRMWNPEKYGWSIMEETQGTVDQEFYHSLTVAQAVRRTGDKGVKLGEDLPTTYPGDEAANTATTLINVYNDLKEGLVNYPKWKTESLYKDVPNAMYSLLVNSVNMTPKWDFEDPTFKVGTESAAATNTDEAAAGGSRSLKIDAMRYSWSGLRHQFPATAHKKFRFSFDAKSTGNDNTVVAYFVDHHPTDWNSKNDRDLFRTNITFPDTEWQKVSFDVDTKGDTQGIMFRMSTRDWEGGHFYIDNFIMLDITELYLMQEACASNNKARAVIDAAIGNKTLTAEEYATAMKTAAEILIEENADEAMDLLVPILTTMRNSKVSPDAGITYTSHDVKPGRTYKLTCHAWVTKPEDKVQYFVKHGDEIIAQWETNSQTWTDEFITFVAPENGDPVTVEIWKPQGVGSAHVDDVRIHEYDPIVYKARTSSKYIQNNEMEDGELWPWYSFDADLEFVETDKGTSLKVTGSRAMQDVRPLPVRKSFVVSGDLKLAMPGVASREAEINIHIIDGKSNGTRITYPIGKATITNNGWTHIEGVIDVSPDLQYDSIGYTAGLVGGDGVFLLDNAKIEEMPMPTTPGTGDGMTFEQIMADTKGWVSTTGDQGMSINKTYVGSTNGNIGYMNESFRDFRITFQMRIENFTPGNYPSITMRNTSTNPTYGSGYTFIIKQDNIELQKYGSGITDNWLFVGAPDSPTGIYGPAVFSDVFKMDEWNTVTIGTTNEEKGVRIYLEVNGFVYYDYVDVVSTVDNAGTIAFCKNGVGRIEVRTVQK